MGENKEAFNVVLRGSSTVVFWENERLAVDGFPSSGIL